MGNKKVNYMTRMGKLRRFHKFTPNHYFDMIQSMPCNHRVPFLQQCINSIDRALLNEELLQEAASTKNIRILFDHKVQNVDFEKKIIGARNVRTGEDVSSAFDLIIGADGSYSVVRRQMMRVVRYAAGVPLVYNRHNLTGSFANLLLAQDELPARVYT